MRLIDSYLRRRAMTQFSQRVWVRANVWRIGDGGYKLEKFGMVIMLLRSDLFYALQTLKQRGLGLCR